jgi:D-ribulokinase
MQNNSRRTKDHLCAVGIDLGTSGVRAAIVDGSGQTRAFTQSPFHMPRHVSEPDAWWRGVTDCLLQLNAMPSPVHIAAIAVAGTSGTLLPVNNNGSPLANASLYNQQADVSTVSAISRASSCDSVTIAATSALARAIELSNAFPGSRILHQADWIVEKLSGHHAPSDENNALKTGYDPVRRCWPSWIENCGFDPRCLPKVMPVGTEICSINPNVAQSLKLSPKTMIFSGTTDGCASFLATGASTIGDAVTSLGSTLIFKILCSKPVFAPALGIYSHRIGDSWLSGGASNAGGAALLTHFTVAAMKHLESQLRPDEPTGLNYYPLPSKGERFPVPNPLKESIVSPRPKDDALFFQGLLEGLATIECDSYRQLALSGAAEPLTMRSTGGASENAAFMRIRQRILGVPFLHSDSVHAAVGAARIAIAGLKKTPLGLTLQ